MKLLVFGHNDWWVWQRQGFCTRNAALVKALTARPEVEAVAVVDAPRFFTRSHRPERRRGEPFSEVAPKVRAVAHSYPLPLPARWALGWHANDDLTRRPLFDRCRTALGDGEPVVWVADPRLVWMATSFPARLLVFDAIDDWRFHRWAGPKLIDDGYRLISERAGLTFAVNGRLLDSLNPRGPSRVLYNAVDVTRWEQAEPNGDMLAGMPRPVVAYVGNLQARVDLPLVAEVARAVPEATFVLAGPLFRGLRLPDGGLPPNMRLIGPVPHSAVPGFLAACEACIVPHVADGLALTMDPLKFYEYLAAGRPVVSTLTPPNPRLVPFVRVAATAAPFAQALREEIEADGPERRQARRDALREETWERRADEVLAAIEVALTPREAPHA
jgi:glycosyltransferase involved in cell wall biosynthesis